MLKRGIYSASSFLQRGEYTQPPLFYKEGNILSLLFFTKSGIYTVSPLFCKEGKGELSFNEENE
jgi:hypothetical protein